MIGGGFDYFTEAVQLLVDGHVMLWNTGTRREMMFRVEWNVKKYIGRRARLRLMDFSSNSSVKIAHVNFDDFRGDAISCGGNCLFLQGRKTSTKKSQENCRCLQQTTQLCSRYYYFCVV